MDLRAETITWSLERVDIGELPRQHGAVGELDKATRKEDD